MPFTAFEQPDTRQLLLDIFNDCHGSNIGRLFTPPNLGLWATFLNTIGLDPQQFSTVNHRLLECGFLNIAFDGSQIIIDDLIIKQQVAQAEKVDCIMIPCVRQPNLATLNALGYVCVPGFFNPQVSFDNGWRAHLKNTLSPKYFKNFLYEMNKLGDHYPTRWLTLNEFIADTPTFEQAMTIYAQNAKNFNHPALHYTKAVLERINETHCAEHFHIALTYTSNSLVKVVVHIIDKSAGAIAALVHGIDYDKVQFNHNLYKQVYYDTYQYMDKNNFNIFDMGRGYVDIKQKLGANRVDPLFTYLKPLNESTSLYVNAVQQHSQRVFNHLLPGIKN